MTAEELLYLDDEPNRHELIKGELLTMSPAGDAHGIITMRLAGPLCTYVDANDLGVVYASETGFKLEHNPDTVLAPDIAFIRGERMTELVEGFRSGSPDLIVEVLSPGQSRRRARKKAAQWLGFGALVVWLIDPKAQTIEVCRQNGQFSILSITDELDGEDLVPGFTIPVAKIFR